MLSLLIFAIVVNVITGNARENLMNKILCECDFVLMSEKFEGFERKVFVMEFGM